MNPSIEVYDTEIVNVIKQLHKSYQDIWKITQDGKLDTHSRYKVLNDCKPQEITWNEYMKDYENLANNEKNLEKRPECLDKSNSVIKIHEKNGNLRELTEKMPDWWISSTWAPVSEDSEDNNESHNE
ncbi:hypothetical protein RhiirC2_750896, partial [Rhizophagus irregularis]